MSTLERLEELEAAAPRSPFRPDFEDLVVPLLLDFPQFVEVGLLKPEHFNKLTTRWVVAEVLNYHERYHVVPSRAALQDVLERKVTEDDPYEEIFGLVKRHSDPRDILYVKEKLKDWLRDRAYGQIYSDDAVEAYHRRDYKALENIVMQAARVHSFDQGEPFGFMDLTDLLGEETELDWLIENILQRDQPFLVGGKDKCLKTGLVVDMAVSLATGTPFLGKFACKPTRVAFISAESGKDNLRRRFRAVQTSKGLTVSEDLVKVSFARPQLSSPDDLAKIGEVIDRYRSQVVIIDPMYLTLLGGDETGASPSNMFDMGMKYGDLCTAITARGATPILVHHYKKSTPEGKLGLDEFAFTGAGSFARQSLHIGRRAPFSSTKTNQMCLMNHGEGIGNYYYLDIDEGETLQKWVITGLEPASLITQRQVRVKAYENVGRLLDYLREKGPSSKSRIREDLGLNDRKFTNMIQAAGERIRSIMGGKNGNIRLYALNEETDDD
jgi:hypothetical protein